MNKNRVFSQKVYGVQNNSINKGDVIGKHYVVVDVVNTDKDTIGNEKVPKENGMQAMVVGEVKEAYKEEDLKTLKKIEGYPESVVKNELTIAYAGTKGWQDMKTNGREIFTNDKHSDGAFQSALNYAKEVQSEYPEYKISTTGHSLGGAEAIYVAALLGVNAVTYGAAGSGLTEKQINAYEGTIINIYDTSDAITGGLLTGGKNKIPFYSFGIDNKGWETYGHSLKQFKLDDHGNYINKYDEIAIYSDLNGGISVEQTLLAQQMIANYEKMRFIEQDSGNTNDHGLLLDQLKKENKLLQAQINSFTKLNELKTTFKMSNGGISKNEQIYLDDSQALAVVQSASSSFELAMENTIKVYEDGITDLEELWRKTKSKALDGTPDLTYGEVMDVLSSVGCTERNMVIIPSELFIEKISQATKMSEQFDQLAAEITGKIAELVQKDQELAEQLG